MGTNAAIIRKPIVGLDVDNTLANVKQALAPIILERFHKNIYDPSFKAYDFEGQLGISRRQMLDLVRMAWSEPRSIQTMDPMLPAILDEINQKYYNWVTTATPEHASLLHYWMALRALRYDKTTIVDTSEQKVNIPGIAVHVDDSPIFATKASAKGLRTILLENDDNRKFAAANIDPNIIPAPLCTIPSFIKSQSKGFSVDQIPHSLRDPLTQLHFL